MSTFKDMAGMAAALGIASGLYGHAEPRDYRPQPPSKETLDMRTERKRRNKQQKASRKANRRNQ